uniref:Putative secreted protein n=1 Tax=Panstrongylus lignarius TaxID=156445 RepID=A0A224XR91_9HEMI
MAFYTSFVSLIFLLIALNYSSSKLVSPTEEELVEYREMLDELNRSSSVIFKHIEGGIDREIVYLEELLNKNGEQVKVEITDEDKINEEEEFNNE